MWPCALRMPMPGSALTKSQPAMMQVCRRQAQGSSRCSAICLRSGMENSMHMLDVHGKPSMRYSKRYVMEVHKAAPT